MTDSLGMKWVLGPADKFTMGSPNDAVEFSEKLSEWSEEKHAAGAW